MAARRRGREDGGQVTVLVGTIVLLVAVGAIMVVAAMGGVVNDRQRARTAADAAALAGVVSGHAEAGDIARRNGGTLEAYRTIGPDVEATVRVGRARATSRAAPARRSPTDGAPGRIP